MSIQILVENEMSASQLTTYYKCKSITISDVYVEALTPPELAQENCQTPEPAL